MSAFKKIIGFFLIYLLPGIVLYIGYEGYLWYQQDQEIRTQISHAPAFELYDLDGRKIDFHQPIKKVFIGFHPQCDYCQLEVQELNREQFDNVEFYWIAMAPVRLLNGFKNKYIKQPNHYVLADTLMQFESYFPAPINPCLYIYDEQNQLIDYFHGKAEVAELKKVLAE